MLTASGWKRGLNGTLVAIVVVIAITGGTSARGQCGNAWKETGSSVSGFDNTVYSTTTWDPDGAGPQPELLIAGGVFTFTGTGDAKSIASWDGTSWQPMGSGIDGSVRALTVCNGELIAGGNFTTAGGSSAKYIARWDGTSWQPLGAGMNNSVRALTVYNGDLIAGGQFTTAGGATANYIARWNGTSWQPLGAGVNGGVLALTVFNGRLIAGGAFISAGGVSANRIASWDGTSWQPIGTGMDASVNALTVYNGELIAGGDFETADGITVDSIARWNGASWQPVVSGLEQSFNLPHINCLAVYENKLIFGGVFMSINSVPVSNIASWDGVTWYDMGGTEYGGYTFALTVYDDELILGGSFQRAGLSTSYKIAAWDGTFWRPLARGVTGSIKALAVYDGELIAGGDFQAFGEAWAQGIARWNGTLWQPVSKFDCGPSYHYDIWDFAVYGGDLIVSGGLPCVDGMQQLGGLARWDGSSWQRLGTETTEAANALTVYSGDLIAGGTFNRMGGIWAAKIARWNGTSWQPLGSGMNSPVYALTVYNGELVAGGWFTTAGGVTANRIARWNGTSWQPLGAGMNGSVNALIVYDGQLIAGGDFTTAGGASANRIAAWDGAAWHSLGTGMAHPSSTPGVNALLVYRNELIAGGYFATAGDVSAQNIARWNGTTWQPLNGSSFEYRRVNALAEYNGDVVVGTSYGYGQRWTTWGPVSVAPDFDCDHDVDAQDLDVFVACATGPQVPYDPGTLPEPSPGCTLTPDTNGKIVADFDLDGDVDQSDFAVFQRCLGDEQNPSDLLCAD